MAEKITPPKLGSTYRADNPTTILQTLIAPASNTKGVIIYAAWIYYGPGNGRLMSKASAPTAWNDAAARTISVGANEGASARPMFTGAVALPVVIPPGEGLYFQGSSSATAANAIDVNAEIL